MREVQVINLTRDTVLAERAAVAETPGARNRGLLGTGSLAHGCGLLIVPCRQVHTFGMRYAIDVVFADEAWEVKRVVHAMKPNRLGALVLRARIALELPTGKAAVTGTRIGDMLDAREVTLSNTIGYPSIDHVNRYVTDVDEHIAFYRETLGYEVIDRGRKGDGARYAILGGQGHELFVSEAPRGEAGIRHIGYTVADADALLERLQKKGIAGGETEIIVKEYSRQFYLRDPDGNEIDFIQWTDKERFREDRRGEQ